MISRPSPSLDSADQVPVRPVSVRPAAAIWRAAKISLVFLSCLLWSGCDANQAPVPESRLLTESTIAPAPTSEADIVYEMRFDDASRHLMDITASFQATLADPDQPKPKRAEPKDTAPATAHGSSGHGNSGHGHSGHGSSSTDEDHEAEPAPFQDLDLKMAVWTPGSYLVREYSRHVEGVSARTRDGQPLDIHKIAKNRWRVSQVPEQEVIVQYRVYAREMTVRTNFVDHDIAILNGAPTFMIPVGGESLSHELRIHLPPQWPHSATALERISELDDSSIEEAEAPDTEEDDTSGDDTSEEPASDPVSGPVSEEPATENEEIASSEDSPQIPVFRSPDFDTLVDSPILLGKLERHGFEVEGIHHELVQAGDYSLWDNVQAAEDVAKLTRQQHKFWGVSPYPHYYFLNAITESGGGLEHKDSTLMLTGRWRGSDDDGYRRWLGLVSHELFHAWNVKRLRPKTLGPFDYENENYTHSLWFAEGLTSYYGPLLMRRAGLITDKQFLKGLSSSIDRTQSTEGRHVRSLADSSYDAWIKFYRPDENSGNTSVDYYGKGAVVGFLLDAEIRRHTQNRESLDALMRLAYERYSGDTGFVPEDIRRLASEVAGHDMNEFFDRYIDGTEELDYQPALQWYGLQFGAGAHGGGSHDDDEKVAGWLGARARDQGGRFVVGSVPRNTPAWDAGLNVDDEIIAIDAYRVTADNWSSRLEHYPPGTEADLWIARRGQMRTLKVTFGTESDTSWKLSIDSGSGAQARRHRQSWLDG